MTNSKQVGTVVIGRNEGERLKRCIDSAKRDSCIVVYVDSGSTDGSVAWAKSEAIEVVELDMSVPFTAARARNQGFERLIEVFPELTYAHFIDGDCYFQEDWLDTATEFLDTHHDVALVCGVRKEICPEASIYNYLCDLEWDGPKGDIKESGGDFLIRVSVMQQVDGFSSEIIAGEEPDLCFRIRQNDGRIHRLPAVMTYHDANIKAFSQWWKRNVRSGHAYANIADLHYGSQEKIYQKEVLSNLVWGAGVPAALLLMSFFWLPAVLWMLLYGLLFFRCMRYAKSTMNLEPDKAAAYSFYIVMGKFPHAQGVFQYAFRRVFRRKHTLIEYK